MTKHVSLSGHSGCVNTIHFSEDGGYAITGSDDTDIMFFDVNTGSQTQRLETTHSNNIFFAKDVPRTNSTQLLSCAADGRVVHMHVEEHRSTTLHRHSGRAHRLALVPDEPDVFYSCGEDGKCYFYDLRTAGCTHFTSFTNASSYNCPIYMLGINPARVHEIAVVGGLSRARIYDARMGGSMYCGEYYPNHLSDSSETITGIKYNHSGEQMVLSYNDECIYTLDTTKHNKIHQTTTSEEAENDYIHCFKGHRNAQTVKQVTYYGHNSEYVVSGSDCGHIFIWCAETAELVKILHGDSIGAINCLTPHPYLPMLGTAGLDRDAKLWLPLGPATKYVDMNATAPLTPHEQEQRVRSVIDANDVNRRENNGHVFAGTPLQLLRLMGFAVEDDDVAPDAEQGGGERRMARNQLLHLMEYLMQRAEVSTEDDEQDHDERSSDDSYGSSEESEEISEEEEMSEQEEEMYGEYAVDMQSVESETKDDYDEISESGVDDNISDCSSDHHDASDDWVHADDDEE